MDGFSLVFTLLCNPNSVEQIQVQTVRLKINIFWSSTELYPWAYIFHIYTGPPTHETKGQQPWACVPQLAREELTDGTSIAGRADDFFQHHGKTRIHP